MPTQEQILKKRIKSYIESIGGYWILVQGGAFSKPGDPDIVACIKGRFVGIEAKTSDGKIREIQKVRAEQIVRSGGLHVFARSVEDVRDILEQAELIETP